MCYINGGDIELREISGSHGIFWMELIQDGVQWQRFVELLVSGTKVSERQWLDIPQIDAHEDCSLF